MVEYCVPMLIYFCGAKKIFFTNTMTPFYKFPNVDFYPVLHDLWVYKFPNTVSKAKEGYYYLIFSTIKKTAKKIITVSHTARKELIDFYNCDKDFIEVIYNYFSFGETPVLFFDDNQQKCLLDKYNISSKKYILSVANLNKRKNLRSLVEAYNGINSDIKLVLVGQKQNEQFPNKNQNIIFTGYLTDEEVKVLYKHALVYAFPSLYEGFGIPLIDAQSFGVPVLCSDIDAFREIGGDSVEYCSIDSEGIKEKLEYLLNNKTRCEELINLGYENIKKFYKENIIFQIKSLIDDNMGELL